jgi:hypothetical protein
MTQETIIQPPVMGTENEYSPLLVWRGGRRGLLFHGYDEDRVETAERLTQARMHAALPAGIIALSRSGLLSSSDRLYTDHKRPEFASGECEGFVEGTHKEFAGELLVTAMLDQLCTEEDHRLKLQSYTLYKRVIDDSIYEPNRRARLLRTWGYHINMMLDDRTFRSPELRAVMIAHLVTMSALYGAGLWLPTRDDPARVVPAQKLQSVTADAHADTVNTKPIFNLRNEPHAGKGSARLHIVSADPNMSPHSTWAKFGSTASVIELARWGLIKDPSHFEFAKPVRAAHQAANDHDGTALLEMKDGRFLRTVDIQEELTELKDELLERHEASPEFKAPLAAWSEDVDYLRHDPDRLIFQTDVRTLAHAMQRSLAKHSRLKGRERFAAMLADSRAWDSLKPAGLGMRLREKMAFPGFDPVEVQRLVQEPGSLARPRARGDLIRRLHGLKRTIYGDWARIHDMYHALELPDPRYVSRRKVEQFYQAVATKAPVEPPVYGELSTLTTGQPPIFSELEDIDPEEYY